MIEAFTQVRQQVRELCDQKRFSTARLYLIGAGCSIETHTSLWEYIARQCDAAGNANLASAIRNEIWDAGVGSSDLALRAVDKELERGDYEAAEFRLETTFGANTENHEAKRRYAQSYFRQAEKAANSGGRLRTDRSRALSLAADFSFRTPTDATVLIDLLRYSGELSLALEKTELARQQFGNHVRFDTREARIREQLYQLDAAASLWEDIAANYENLRGDALIKLSALYERLERPEALRRTRALLATTDVSLDNRLMLALSAGQDGMAHALSEYLGRAGTGAGGASTEAAVSFVEQLLDFGETGLAVWLRRQRVPVGNRVKKTLDAIGFSVGGQRDLPDTVAEATKIRSPEFMFPLEKTLKLRPKPAGWPGTGKDPRRVLLVNITLAIGGAERQFVELVRALLSHGLSLDQVHVAIFSLNEDRGHAYFLQELQSLGVTVHDLLARDEATARFSGTERGMVDALPSSLRSDVRLLMPLVEELRPDVLHGWQDRSAAACAIVGVAKSVERIVLSARNMSPVTRRDKGLAQHEALFREMLGKGNVAFTANSRVAASDYCQWLGFETERIDVIPNAIANASYPNLEKETRAETREGPIRIGGVFRLAINKRPLLWLRTIHALRHDHGISLQPMLFGSGPLAPEVEAEAKLLGLDDLILRSGLVDPVEIYGEMDVLLLMSQVEGLPNVLLEAQAMGKPVVACDVGGVREAVKLGGKGAGLILEADINPTEAAAQIVSWLPEALRAPPHLIQRHVQGLFSAQKLAERTLAVYRGHKVSI